MLATDRFVHVGCAYCTIYYAHCEKESDRQRFAKLEVPVGFRWTSDDMEQQFMQVEEFTRRSGPVAADPQCTCSRSSDDA